MTKYLNILVAILIGSWISIDIGESPLHSGLYQRTYLQVCETIRDNYYEESEKLTGWVKECFKRANNVSDHTTVRALIRDIDSYLNELAVSHLSIWDPTAMRSQWLGESRESGIRARRIKDHFIVIKLVENGPAQIAGIQIGDEIVSINGKPIQGIWDIRNSSGVFSVLRHEGGVQAQIPIREGMLELQFNIVATNLMIDSRPVFELIEEGQTKKIGVLTIPSFVSTYFDEPSWREVVKQIVSVDRVIVDIRENAGGNFAAMLRGLSPFFCEPTIVGKLVKPRKIDGKSEDLENNLDHQYQAELIERVQQINLRTFTDYGCFSGEVVVLMDHDSASTAEVFAQAFALRNNSRVLGDFSAGEVVQAVWHPLPLGTGFSLSVPDSMFVTVAGHNLEGVGVRPLKILDYDLDLARDGIDSWIQEALN